MTTLPFFEVMMGLSKELKRLSEAVERMQDLVCIGQPGPAENEARLIQDAQSIDHTTQVLTELSRYVADLATDGPQNCFLQTSRALASLRLSELQQRLALGTAAQAQQSSHPGTLELF